MERGAMLVLVRHGQSQWNKENRFTGWIDIDLCEEGVEECRRVAHQLREESFDIAFTSELVRAWRSLDIILEELGLEIPVIRSWTWNERHYGDLQGMNKDEARQKFGEEQVQRWRRGFHDRPEGGESLQDTYDRVIPFFNSWVLSELYDGNNVLVVAHGNSLRALVKYLENLDEEEIINLDIPTGEPIFYALQDQGIVRIE